VKPKPTIVDLIAGIRIDVIYARHHFQVYRTYVHRRSRQKYNEVLFVYGHFFKCSEDAHFVALMAALGRVFDKKRGNIGIAMLLDAEPELKKLEPRILACANALWEDNAIHIRHEFVAHRPSRTTVKETFERAEISLNKIGQLIGFCEKLVDVWSRKAGCHVHNRSSVKEDLIAVLDTLFRAREASRQGCAPYGRSMRRSSTRR
jgi:hypothetical protein